MAVVQPIQAPDASAALGACFERQKAAYHAHPVPSVAERRADLRALKALLNDNREAIIAATTADYGCRSRHETLFGEVISVTDGINDCIRKLGRWAKPQRRHVDLSLFAGGRNRVVPQPLGCVGIIVPWNFPLFLAFGPLSAALAAGNRAMVKMSENSRHLSRLLIELAPRYFSTDKVCFLEETGGVGIAFSRIPFDLLFFTGSGETGRKVMAAAAANLTPVVLELGGKSPAVIDPRYPLDKAVQRILFVKQFNAGQICVNVDYVFVQREQVDAFVAEAQRWTARHVPDIHSRDYTALIDERSYQRMLDTLADARSKGARVINLTPHQAPDPGSRKVPLHLVLDTTPDMIIRQRETFGPLLMVLPYDDPQEVIEHVRAHDRPLAFYPFSRDRKLVEHYLTHTMSGGVTVNDALFHVAQHDMPFGGVGASGMGQYHGFDGFRTFSKMRPVFHQAPISAMRFLQPPYGRVADLVYRFLVWLKS